MNKVTRLLLLCTVILSAQITTVPQTHAQCETIIANAVQSPLTLTIPSGSTANLSLTYAPTYQIYYGANSTASSSTVRAWDPSGNALTTVTTGRFYRGIWWNVNTGQLEGNEASYGPISYMPLDAAHYPVANTATNIFATANGLSTQNCATYDPVNNEMVYYFSGTLQRVSRATNAIISTAAVTGFPTSPGNINSTIIMYTGAAGKEYGVYDYINRRFYFISRATNAYVGMSQLPATAATPFNFKIAYANDLFWIGSGLSWNSYQVLSGPIIYVDSSVAVSGTGYSWASPLKTVNEALDVANAKSASCTSQIWVRKGTYYPTTGTSRDSSFRILTNNIKLYGGFAGTETALTDRTNISGNPTILSGDIGTANVSTDNSYHVLTIVGNSSNNIDTNTIIDGFTITGGNANGSGTFSSNSIALDRTAGGGVIAAGIGSGNESSPQINSCTIKDNAATNGGGLYCAAQNGGKSRGYLNDCTFDNNTATNNGGAIAVYTDGSGGIGSPTVTSTIFGNNVSAGAGGACYSSSVSPAISTTGFYNGCIFTSNSSAGGSGGGALCFEGNTSGTASAATFSGNHAQVGGAVSSGTGTLNINLPNSVFTSNYATGKGGAYYAFSTGGAIFNASFAGNYSTTDNGGAIHVEAGTLTISNTAFNENRAINGGAVSNAGSGTININGSTFTSDTASFNGGAIYRAVTATGTMNINTGRFTGNYSNSTGGCLTNLGSGAINITSTAFSGNITAQNGGAIESNNTSAAIGLVQCVFADNRTTAAPGLGGGAVHVIAGVATFTNSTLSNNTTASTVRPTGNAISVDVGATVNLNNTIVWGTAASQMASLGTANYDYSDIKGVTATGTNLNVDPQFVNASNAIGADFIWGTTDDGLQVSACSPVINAGSNTLATGIFVSFTGSVRTSGGTVDIGAYELANASSIIYVDSSVAVTGTGSSWASPFKTVTEALNVANNSACTNQIWVAKGTYYPMFGTVVATSRDSSFRILRNGVKMYGGFAGGEVSIAARNVTLNPTILSGDIGIANDTTDNAYHVLTITTSSGTFDTSTRIDGFTITKATGGLAGSGATTSNGFSFNRQDGGGIYLGAGANGTCSPQIVNCIVSLNAANFGGGMYCNSFSAATATVSPIITNCTFTQNRAISSGGGIIFNSISGLQKPTFFNTTFSQNTANNGGGVFSNGDTASYTNCTFTSNSAVVSGGAMSNTNDRLTFSNCTFNTNTAVNSGAGVIGTTDTLLFSSCIFTGNTTTGSVLTDGGAVSSFGNSWLALTDCSFSANAAPGNRGGAVGASGNGSILRCTFTGNSSLAGGAVSNVGNGKSFTINNCQFTSNAASTSGGAVISQFGSSLNLTNSSFTGNNSGNNGGVLYSQNNGLITIANDTFINNKCTGFGGALAYNGNPGVTSNSVFKGNRSNGNGGAAYFGNATTVTNCTFQQDTAASGGALYLTGSTNAYVNRNFLEGNVSLTGNGGGISSTNSTDTIVNNVFYRNHNFGSGGGGMSHDGGATVASLIANNTCYKDTTAGAGGGIRLTGNTGTVNVYNNILWQDIASGGLELSNVTTGTAVVNSGNNLSASDPLFTNAANSVGADNLWGTADDGLQLTACSPAINFGLNAPIVTIVSDARNTTRIQQTTVDAGAYESSLISSVVVPAVSVAASPSGAICTGTNVTFTATPSNGGTSPVYLWRKNGTVVGGTTATYSDNTLANGDVITVRLTSNATCRSSDTANSPAITMVVNPIPAAPSLSTNGPVCAGSIATLLAANVTNGTFAWTGPNSFSSAAQSITINNAAVSDGGTYTATVAVNGCTSPSASILLVVNPALIPSVSVATNPGTAICSGTQVTFTATPTNGGTSPVYQWRKNGTNVGTGATYTDNTLANGDVITVRLTSNALCRTLDTVNSTSIVMTVTTSVVPTVSLAAAPSGAICAGTNVTFTATPSNGGTTPVYLWRKNGTTVGGTTATYSDNTLANGDIITVRLTSNATCRSVDTANSSAVTMTVNPNVTPSITFTSNPTGAICAGTPVTFTATAVNGGTAAYQWRKNGTGVGTNSNTYTDNALNNGDVITVKLTSTASCRTLDTVNSASTTINVNPVLIPSVSASANTGTTICAGTPVTFTATPTNGGTIPVYQWRKNGTNVGTGTTYVDNTLANGDVITVRLTSNALCRTLDTVNSIALTMTVTTAVVPAVTVSPSPSGAICTGTNVTFTATPVNGGTTPLYQWRKNGTPVGGTGAAYSDNTLNNGDVITVRLTSNATCRSIDTANSAAITMVVSGTVTPSISFTALPSGPICPGTPVTFTATATNGGTTPAFQWRKNGTSVGTGTSTYTDNALNNGDVITVRLTSNAGCRNADTVNSAATTVTVNPALTPSVSVSPNTGTTICGSTTVAFTATPTNGGTVPVYLWRKNGTPVGGTTATYTDNTLVNGDVITVRLTSNAPCRTLDTVNSSAVTMTVTTVVVPAVTVSPSPSGAICTGTNVTFTATPSNGGAAPIYQWQKNGTPVGGATATYSDNALLNGDVITVRLTSNATCRSTDTANSSAITMVVNSSVTPSVSFTANPSGAICSGTPVTFTATAVNGGTTPVYQWRKNGTNVGTGATYNDNTLNNGDVITVRLTSNASCRNADTVNSTGTTITVNPAVTPSVTISANPGAAICAGTPVTFTATPVNGGSPVYQWRKNGLGVGTNSSTYTDNALANGDIITVRLTSNAGCRTVDSANSTGITMTVTPAVTPSVTVSPNPSGPICAGANVTFTATAVNGGATPAYQWRKNGNSVGSNAATYSDNTLVNGDVITVRLTSNAGCRSTDTANSTAITMTVNTIVVPAVTIIASPSGAICSGTPVTYTATPVNGGTTPVYQWRKNGTSVGTGGISYTDNALVNGDVITVRMTSNAGCRSVDTANSSAITAVVNPGVTPAVTIAANPGTSICTGVNVTFTASPTNPGTTPAYQWRKNGTNVGTGAATYADNALNNGDVITVRLTSNANCRTIDTVNSAALTMTVNTVPAQPGAITGNSKVCANSAQTYSITAVANTNTYTWTLPSGWSGTSSSNSINATAATASGIGTISVTANNVCGSSTPRTLADTVVNTPAQPGTITGNTRVCGGSAQTYSITAVNEATTYTWTLPTGWSGSATTNSINATAAAASGTGTITVTAGNFCGTSTARTLADTVINTPATPGSITGNVNICAGSNQAYSIGVVPDAASYIWTPPSTNGWTSPGSTTNSINTTAGTVTGPYTITVKATNQCGTSAAQSLTVNLSNIPATPGTITGNTNICGGTQQQYNIAAVPEATTYTWTVPTGSGWTTTGTTTSTFLNTTAGTGSGNITVTATNFCGTSAPKALAVTVTNIPATPGTITGNTNVCGGTAQLYKIARVNSATSYTWTAVGNGWTQATGTPADTFVNTTAGTAATTITVTATNFCGTSAAQTLAVNVTNIPGQPGTISGRDSLCSGSGDTYSIGAVNEATSYTWTPPTGTGITGTAAANGLSYSLSTTGATPGGTYVLTVKATNGCGTGPEITKSIVVTPVQTASVGITSTNPAVCSGQPITFTATGANAGSTPLFQWMRNGLPTGTASATNTFTSTTLNSGDQISVQIRSSATCPLALWTTSNTIQVTITPTLTPGVSINSNYPSSIICVGTPVTFNVAATIGSGTAPQYQWRKNGTTVGTNSTTYTDATLNTGDSVSVIMTSNYACLTQPDKESNKIGNSVFTTLTPTVSVQVNPGTNVAPGTTVTFTAQVTNVGPNPQYQWFKNGQAIGGATTATYSSNTLSDGDAIGVRVGADLVCANPGVVNSAARAMTIHKTGVNNYGTQGLISLYPNPTEGRFTVKLTGSAAKDQTLNLEVTNTVGQTIYKARLQPDGSQEWQTEIELPQSIASGAYLIRFTDEQGRTMATRKIDVVK